MSRVQFVISDKECWLEVNGERIENIKVNSHDSRVNRGHIYENYNSKTHCYTFPEPKISINFSAEFTDCKNSDFKIIILPSAPEIAQKIEEEVIKALKAFANPKKVYLPRGYFDKLVKYYSLNLVMKSHPQIVNIGQFYSKSTWRGLEVVEEGEVIRVE